jgi:CubicO group peptidase (beta-lactamase class C family)
MRQDDGNMKQIDTLMHRAVKENIFPGGVLLASIADAIVFFDAYGVADTFSGRPMARDTVFDLASLTKPLATTLSVMSLVVQSKLELEHHLGSILPAFKNTDKSGITVKHLLCHNSGLPDYRPYYETLMKLPPKRRRSALQDLLVKEPPMHPKGFETVYSDLGFMILGWIVEHLSGRRLDRFVSEEIYTPLDLENLFFIDLHSKPRKAQFAATEVCPWRNILLNGTVHDDNAYAMGGIEGHAGLFGTAMDVYRLLSVLLSDFYGRTGTRLFEKDLMKTFLKRRNVKGRALGFDTPSLTAPSCGQYFSNQSVGHLGFTGTSFWMDLERSAIVILLTNRVHPSRGNTKIKTFRPLLHDVIMKTLSSNFTP